MGTACAAAIDCCCCCHVPAPMSAVVGAHIFILAHANHRCNKIII
jgi:hypothetical protein